MGIEGAYTFKRGCRTDDNPFVGLRDFVEESLQLYRKEKPDNLECQRTGEWMGDAALIGRLRRHALT